MNYKRKIATTIIKSTYDNDTSRPIIKIAIASVAISLIVMLVAKFVVQGFQTEVAQKVSAFGSHIVISKYDRNNALEESFILKDSLLINKLKEDKHVIHSQYFAIKSGISKSKVNIQGLVLKGVGSDYDWSTFKNYIKYGDVLTLKGGTTDNGILISEYMANLLELKLGDKMVVYFIQQPPKSRAFKIKGIYNTGLGEKSFDKSMAFIDINQIQKLNQWETNQVYGIELILDNLDNLNASGNAVYKAIPPEYKSETISQRFSTMFEWLRLQDLNVVIIITLIMIVASLNILTLLLTIILQKTRMIGLLKTLGSTTKDLFYIFGLVSSKIMFKGMLIGNAVGLMFCFLQHQFKLIPLNQSIYYLSYVPIEFNWIYFILLNIGLLLASFFMVAITTIVVGSISPSKSIKTS